MLSEGQSLTEQDGDSIRPPPPCPQHRSHLVPLQKTLLRQAMIVSGAVPPIIVLANSGSFETKTQCMSILQRMLLGRAMPDEVSTEQTAAACLAPKASGVSNYLHRRGAEEATNWSAGTCVKSNCLS